MYNVGSLEQTPQQKGHVMMPPHNQVSNIPYSARSNRSVVKGKTFQQWMAEVDRHLDNMVGLDSRCLPDMAYRTLWESRFSPKQVAKKALTR